VEQVAPTDSTVLISGETGTGKELIARAIHSRSARKGRALVKVNCAAISAGLVESELFGHVKGAFTGAIERRIGRFELADGGTIFLDEVGELTPAVQVRLLRTLELGEVRPVGASRVLHVDARVIAATHRDLERAVREETFRQDLYYRLNVFRIVLPPLRERREDIPLLAAHVLREVASREGRPASLSPAAVEALIGYAWPGNVRELANTLERLALSTPGGVIDVEDLPAAFRERAPAPHVDPIFAGLPTLEEMEKRYLQHVLAAVGGNRSRAAEVLGIDRRTLYRMAERFGLELDKTEG
jgi:transcriptional regulator with GAF, ATPase, and Fis domain